MKTPTDLDQLYDTIEERINMLMVQRAYPLGKLGAREALEWVEREIKKLRRSAGGDSPEPRCPCCGTRCVYCPPQAG